VCATIEQHDGRSSSRAKDLVDLTIIALTQQVDGEAASANLTQELSKRELKRPRHFTVPDPWRAKYTKLASNTPASVCSFDEALSLVTAFVDPLLTAAANGMHWDPSASTWMSQQPH
jgi:hypothetical protein